MFGSMHDFTSSPFLNWTSPRAHREGLRYRSSVDYIFQASPFCSYIQHLLLFFIIPTEFRYASRYLARPGKGFVYHYCHHYSDEGTTASALARAGREIWPPVSGRSNGVCILTTAFCWTFGLLYMAGWAECFDLGHATLASDLLYIYMCTSKPNTSKVLSNNLR